MPFDPPPLQPSPAERAYIEREELRLRQERAREEADRRQWWESLSEEQRAEVRRQEAHERAQTEKRAEEARLRAKMEEEAHQARIKEHEDRHGGHAQLEQRREWLLRQLNATPRPDPISGSGSLLVMALGALIIAGFAAPAAGGFIPGLIVFEILTVVVWALWMQNRRERRIAHETVSRQQNALPYKFGCGSPTCASCYLEQRVRAGFGSARARLGVDFGCADPECKRCYPEGIAAS